MRANGTGGKLGPEGGGTSTMRQTPKKPVAEKTYKIVHERDEAFDIADYANNVLVSRGAHEVVLTFFQVVIPIDLDKAEDSLPAKPVARVAVPPEVAAVLARLLGQAPSSKE